MTAQVVSKAQQHAVRAGMPIAPKRRRDKPLNPTPTPRYRQPKSCTATPQWRPAATSGAPTPVKPNHPSRAATASVHTNPSHAPKRQVILARRIAIAIAAVVLVAALTLWTITAITAGSDIAVGGQITVSNGQTLWSIASDHAAPGVDVREVIAQIITLNDLPSSGVQVGQQLLLPAP